MKATIFETTVTEAILLDRAVYTKNMAELNLNHKAPIVAYEGLNVRVKNTGAIHLLFFQFTKEGTAPEADVVAAVALTNKQSWEDMKKLVDEQIEQAEKSER